MNKQVLNKTYYQNHKEKIKEQKKERYHTQKQQNKTLSKTSDYYKAANIQILLSLKDYVESSPQKMKLWYHFSLVLTQLKESVSDIIEIIRLKEVMENLITDYWSFAKKNIRLTKSWNKLTFAQQQAKKKSWEREFQQKDDAIWFADPLYKLKARRQWKALVLKCLLIAFCKK